MYIFKFVEYESGESLTWAVRLQVHTPVLCDCVQFQPHCVRHGASDEDSRASYPLTGDSLCNTRFGALCSPGESPRVPESLNEGLGPFTEASRNLHACTRSTAYIVKAVPGLEARGRPTTAACVSLLSRRQCRGFALTLLLRMRLACCGKGGLLLQDKCALIRVLHRCLLHGWRAGAGERGSHLLYCILDGNFV